MKSFQTFLNENGLLCPNCGKAIAKGTANCPFCDAEIKKKVPTQNNKKSWGDMFGGDDIADRMPWDKIPPKR